MDTRTAARPAPAAELSTLDLQDRADLLRERINRFRTSLGRFFVAKQDVIDVMTIAAVAQEPLLIVGPPGTAKSDLVLKFRDALGVADVDYFEYMLTRFTEPSEIIGPIDINLLREGRYVRREQGKLPTARLAFLDEIFKSNSAILNILLTIINERKFYQDGVPQPVSLRVLFAATNEVPEQTELAALKDRFPLKIESRPVQDEHFTGLIDMGLQSESHRALNQKPWAEGHCTLDDLLMANRHLTLLFARREDARGEEVTDRTLFFPAEVFREFQRLVKTLTREDRIFISDRKLVKLYKLFRVRAWLFSGGTVTRDDLRLLAYLGETHQEIELLREKVPALLGGRVMFVNVAQHLPAAARERPHALAVVCPAGRSRLRQAYTHLTCRQLDEESDRIARGLHAVGVRRGMRSVLMVPPSLEFFALTFALFKLGAVLVLIDPGMGVRHLGRCLGEAQAEAFIGVRKAHVARRLLRWAPSARITVGVRTRLFCRHTLNEVRRTSSNNSSREGFISSASVTPDETAAILFTSGSTGLAKGAVYTHGIFAAQVEALRRLYDIRPGEIDLATFPLFALFAPALGMTAVVPEMDPTRPARVHPPNIIRAIEDWGVTNLFGSPALLNALGRWGVQHEVRLPSLRRVISAGAPVPAVVIERITRMLGPEAEVFTPYGATECLPVSSVGSREILGETRFKTDAGNGVCVGQPVSGVDVAIIPISDEPIPAWDESTRLPAGEIGEITVTGPFVTKAYHARPAATRLAKIVDKAGTVWHRMGDVGYLDESGRLWFCGRKSYRVMTPAGTLYTIQVEAVFNTHPAVYRTALVGVGPAGKQTPVLCVELEPSATRIDRRQLIRQLLEIGGKHQHTRPVRTILFRKSFPVDVRHNAKIFREKLAAWAAKQLKIKSQPGCKRR